MILPKERDPRLVTICRGGTLTDADHQLLALWAALCAQHVLEHFERARPGDERPRRPIELGRAWARGAIKMTQARTAAGHANGAPRDLSGAPRHAAYAAGQAAALAHVAAHELGAAAYAIKAKRAAAPEGGGGARRARRVSLATSPAPPVDSSARPRRPAASQRHCWSVFDGLRYGDHCRAPGDVRVPDVDGGRSAEGPSPFERHCRRAHEICGSSHLLAPSRQVKVTCADQGA